jgi:CBS domain-containing protein
MSREVVTASPSMPLKEVARLLVAHRISGVPVVDRDGSVVGVVSEGDIVFKEGGVARPGSHALKWLFDSGDGDSGLLSKREARTVADAMTAPAVVIAARRSVAEAARLMVERSVNRLPVVTDGKLVGILTRSDLVRAFTRTDEELEREIRDDVIRRTLWMPTDDLRIVLSNGEVSLEGRVSSRTEAELLTSYIARVPGVVSVDDSRLGWDADDLARRS